MKALKRKGMNKKGVMGNLNMMIFGSITFVVLVVVLVIGAQVTSTVRDTQTSDSQSYNISGQGLTGFGTFGDYLTIIATVIVLVVIVGLLIGVIAMFARKQ